MVFRKPTHLRCSALQCVAVCCSVLLSVHYTASTLQHTATHCNTLQLTLQRTQPHTANRLTYLTVSDRWRPGVYPAIVSKSNTLQCTLQHTLQHKLQHTVFNIPNCPRSLAPQEYIRPLSARATHCNAHCNTHFNTNCNTLYLTYPTVLDRWRPRSTPGHCRQEQLCVFFLHSRLQGVFHLPQHCNSLQRTLQSTATICSTFVLHLLQHCNSLQRTLQRTATYCLTGVCHLPHHCNIL